MKLILFSSDNCATCKTTRQAFNEVVRRYNFEHEEYVVEKNPEKFAEYSVEGFPCIYIFEGKERIGWVVGNQTETSLENNLKKYGGEACLNLDTK